ncbi:potassium ABC transporter ATPase [Candidatus Thiomargarita nelsonii]|uniref:Potassium ABC transporter ATPase n=1 Tax=Candidatus Thiomargarita nelsonii TaxID=1003181 RepID=A0A0A6PGY4_9GAMM|nr:potassium ABC transporter ATPase [Candidatus Thiomargarita nelsonii]
MAHYIAKKGDFVALTFDPQSGHEQKGRRPALDTDRKIPFHVKIPEESSLTGFVMVEQVKSIDYVARNIRLIEPAPIQLLDEVLAILKLCL